ncbi:MAG TPA: S41 family peptidase [Bacteroidales bacterium]|nr:S41 family peptidase [Bacteroidales bacterium]
MNRKILFNTFAILIAALLLSSSGCNEPITPEPPPETKDPDYFAKVFLRREYMDVYYYWYKDVKAANAKLDPLKYDIYEFYDEMLYMKDRWSWMTDKESYLKSEEGTVTGTYGATLKQPVKYFGDYDVKVRFVYPGSPFDKEGVTRGWTLTAVGGTATMDLIRAGKFNEEYNKSPQKFTFTDVEGNSHTFTATAATTLSTRSVLMSKVFTGEDFEGLTSPVGYMLYLTFNANMLDDIDNAMQLFREAGVKHLILDLRYNGGGDGRASQRIVDYVAPKSAIGETYVIRKHNDLLASQDKYSKVEGIAGSLELDALYFITTKSSASASEMVLNGLEPLMNVRHVGDTTYGKPNGMYVLMYPGEDADYTRYNKGDYSNLKWVFLPICFYNQNKDFRDIPDGGIVPANYRPDDLYHDFGPSEDNIKACLTHIASGTYPPLPAKKTKAVTKTSKERLVKIALTEEETNPKYGSYTIPWKNR